KNFTVPTGMANPFDLPDWRLTGFRPRHHQKPVRNIGADLRVRARWPRLDRPHYALDGCSGSSMTVLTPDPASNTVTRRIGCPLLTTNAASSAAAYVAYAVLVCRSTWRRN